MVPDVEHLGRAAFAEVAEALAVPTDHIVGTVSSGPGQVLVLYTPSLKGKNPPIYRQVLRRSAWGGVYVRVGDRERVEGFYERLGSLIQDGGWQIPPAERGEGGS